MILKNLVLAIAAVTGLAVSARADTRIAAALSEPDPSLLDTRLAGIWYAPFPNYSHERLGFVTYLNIFPNEGRNALEVMVISAGRAGGQSVSWTKSTLFASRVSGTTVFNSIPEDWGAGTCACDGVGLMKIELMGDSILFRHTLSDSIPVKSWAYAHGVKNRTVVDREFMERKETHIYDISKDQFLDLIKEIAPSLLFSDFDGPYYKVVPSLVLSASSKSERRFRSWRTSCEDIETPASRRCVVQDDQNEISITLGSLGLDQVVVGHEQCTPLNATFAFDDDTADDRLQYDMGELLRSPILEQMHMRRVLHLHYAACPAPKRLERAVDVPLDGFAAAFATAVANTKVFDPNLR